jgi:predicted nucleic acid-binding protein
VEDLAVILVDSDVLIAHLRGLPAAQRWLTTTRAGGGQLVMSAVSVAELTGGMKSAERREVWQLLRAFRVEAVTEAVGRRAGELMRQYRRSHSGIGLADYLIAATADVNGHEVATCNVRHFPMFKGLRAPFRLPS